LRFCLPIVSALLASGCLSVADHGAAYELPLAVESSPDTIIWPAWAARGPAASEFRRVYPEGAKAAGLSGLVHLRCTVETALTFACDVEQETPAGHGFGAAALELSRAFAVKADYPNAAPGAVVRLPMRFVLED
jgi:protein TonB